MLPFDHAELQGLVEYAKKVLDTLGVRYGPSHLEIKFSPRGWVIIDPNIRMCGARLPRVVARVTGYSQIQGTVDAFLHPKELIGRASGYTLEKNAAVIFIRAIREGIFDQTEIEKIIAQYRSAVSDVSYQFKQGQSVGVTRDSDSTLGQMSVIHQDSEIIEQIRRKIREAEEAGLVVR